MPENNRRLKKNVSEDTKTHGFHQFCNCVYNPKKHSKILHILKTNTKVLKGIYSCIFHCLTSKK